MKKLFLIILLCSTIYAQETQFINGVDVSFIPELEDLGGQFYLDGAAHPPLDIFKLHGVDYIRLRIWHTPSNGYVGFEETIDMAKRVKANGLKFLLDFHYSDTWADPGRQDKPAAWEGLSFNVLRDSIRNYTYKVVSALKDEGAAPDMVQIGNEIIGGMLWPEGKVGGSDDNSVQWSQFTSLLKSAMAGLYEALPDSSARVMIHIDRGGNNGDSRWFFDNILAYGVEFDIIGQSFYPWWHGTLTDLRNNLNDLSRRYNKDLVVVEIAYPWTLDWYDNRGNIVGSPSQLHAGYPASETGQYNYLYDLIQIVKNVPDGRGIGVFYWAPEYISVQPKGSPWENVTLFDFQGNTLSSMRVFEREEDKESINVTFRMNTALHWDTLSPTGFVQLRGEILNGNNNLPGGERLTWDINSDIIFDNVGGSYWEKTFQIVVGSEMQYKFWTGHDKDTPTFHRLGWEGPVSPYNGENGNYRLLLAGDKDTTLTMEYYNPSGLSQEQYWQLIENSEDSVGVYFKVFMGKETEAGRFDPETEGPLGIRGSGETSGGVLSWETTNVILSREEYSVGGGSFWSGVVNFPKDAVGNAIEFKFFIKNSSGDGWENSIDNRLFVLEDNVQTLPWQYFNKIDGSTPVNDDLLIPESTVLYPNFPNPFNPSTTIDYSIPSFKKSPPGRGFRGGFVKVILQVYNILGKEVATLVNQQQSPGTYRVIWDASGQANGIYFIRLVVNNNVFTNKAVLLK